VIEQLTPQQMRNFHRSKYQPQSMTAVAVGNLPIDELIAIVTDAFTEAMADNDLRDIEPENDRLTLKAESAFQETVRREYVDVSLQQARLVMMWRVPGLIELSETYALDILATILGHGRTTRLVQDLREERGLVSSISVSNMTQRLQGVFYISAQLIEENLAAVEQAIAQHIRTIQTELVTEAEIARVRTQVANRFIFGNETPSDRANLYGYYQSIVGDLAPALNYPAYIQAINATDIQRAACKYLSPDACGVVILRPEK
jgi:predicted Zn-dependent peptidase